MPDRQPIASNFRWLLAANAAVKPLWFVFLLLSTRLLGAAEFGRAMTALSIVTLLGVLLEGGLDIQLVRQVAAAPESGRRFLSHSVPLKIVSGLVVGAVALTASFVAGPFRALRPLMLPAAGLVLCNALLLHLRGLFRARERMRLEAVSLVVERLVVMGLCLVALRLSPVADLYLVVYAVALALTLGLTAWQVQRLAGWPTLPVERNYLWEGVLRPSLPFALMNIFAVVYFRSGTILLSILTGQDALVGHFNAGYRLVESYMLIPNLITAPLYPVLARRSGEGRGLSPLLLTAARAVLLLTLLIAVPMVVYRAGFTRAFFGDEFRSAAPAVGLLSLAMLPVGLNFLFGSLTAVSGRQPRANRWIVGITAGNVLANLVAIPRWGVPGAAGVALLTESALTAVHLALTHDFLEAGPVGRLLFRLTAPVIAGLLAAAAIGDRLAFPLAPAIVVAVMTAAGFAAGLVRVDELRGLLPRRPR